MVKRFDLIVFDWDGTLMDSAAAIVRAIPRWWPDALDRIVEELGA